jgi:hypothetical protein
VLEDQARGSHSANILADAGAHYLDAVDLPRSAAAFEQFRDPVEIAL